MKTKRSTDVETRRALLHEVARRYAEDGLGGKSFEAIPYHDKVSLRAPIAPGGSYKPIVGKENLRTQWWAPLPDLVRDVRLLNTYASKDLDAVAAELQVSITEPSCELRIIDRFTVDDEGRIVEQENFFDPRDLTSPGWRSV